MPLDRPSAKAKLCELLAQHLDRHVDSITDEKLLRDDLGADSLDPLELALMIEDEIGVSISDEMLETTVETVGDLWALIERGLPA